jgi:hypothetical protein
MPLTAAAHCQRANRVRSHHVRQGEDGADCAERRHHAQESSGTSSTSAIFFQYCFLFFFCLNSSCLSLICNIDQMWAVNGDAGGEFRRRLERDLPRDDPVRRLLGHLPQQRPSRRHKSRGPLQGKGIWYVWKKCQHFQRAAKNVLIHRRGGDHVRQVVPARQLHGPGSRMPVGDQAL